MEANRFLLVASAVLAAHAACADALDTTPFSYKCTATVHGYAGGEELTNFPVLVSLADNSPYGFKYGDCASDGSDLRFVDAEGNLIPHEIDTWNAAGESLVWVGLPVLTNGTSFALYYGADNPGAASADNLWSLAGYAGVWHLTDGRDSTTNGLDGTIDVGISAATAAKLGGALDFDSAKMKVGTTPNSDLANGFSLEAWCCPHRLNDKNGKNGNAVFGKSGAMSIRIEGAKIRLTTPSVLDHELANCSLVANEWFHLGLTFLPNPATSGKTTVANRYKVYRDGVQKASLGASRIPNLGSSAEMWLGGNQWPDQDFSGILDEFRLSSCIRSADWIKAAYDTAVDPVSFAPLGAAEPLDSTAPRFGDISVTSSSGSFVVSVPVSENFPSAIVCTVGGTDYAMATSDSSLPATYSAVVSGLSPGTYTTSVRATATSGFIVSADCQTAFHAGALAVAAVSDADEGTLSPGVFRVSRADADPTGLPALSFDVAFSGDGLAAVVAPGVSSLTIPAGAGWVEFSIVPVYAVDVAQDADLVLTVSGANIGQDSSATMTVVNVDFDPSVRYVATTGDDENHGGTPELPKKTIGAAVASLESVSQQRACTIHVAEGRYPVLSPVVVTNAISIVGADADPSRTVVSNAATGGYGNECRVFDIQNREASVFNLTMEHGRITIGNNRAGGVLYIGSGVVSNCVVRDGSIEQRSHAGALGGGVHLDGVDALLTHCVVSNCRAKASDASWVVGVAAAGVYVNVGRVENCLVSNCRDANASPTLAKLTGGIVLDGANAEALNCTVIGCTGSRAGGITVVNSSASARNCVVFDCTKKLKVDEEVVTSVGPFSGDASLFDHCASDAADTYDANDSILGLASGAFEDYSGGDYTPKSGGPLVNAGADYEGMAAFDLAGKTRKNGKRIDIGCYENQKSNKFIVIVR